MEELCGCWRFDWKRFRFDVCGHPADHVVGGKWHLDLKSHNIWLVKDKERERRQR